MTIDRERVAALISQNTPADGGDVLTVLELNGYAVVPQGLVPQFEDLDSVAAAAVRALRDLALLVRRIDPAAMEHSGE